MVHKQPGAICELNTDLLWAMAPYGTDNFTSKQFCGSLGFGFKFFVTAFHFGSLKALLLMPNPRAKAPV